MVIYEVNLMIEKAILEEFAAWLRSHMNELLQLEGFVSAQCYAEEAEGSSDQAHWTVHYHLKDRISLQDYFDHHAARFRQDGVTRFEGRFSATRRILVKI